MGFRFRKSIKIAPGVRINLSKSGVSTSLGGRGHTVYVGPHGVRGTVGIPGTGISYSQQIVKTPGKRQIAAASPLKPERIVFKESMPMEDVLPTTVEDADLLLSRIPDKNRGVAALLGLFPGGGQFYVGQPLHGLAILLTCWLFVPWLWGWIHGMNRAGYLHRAHTLLVQHREDLVDKEMLGSAAVTPQSQAATLEMVSITPKRKAPSKIVCSQCGSRVTAEAAFCQKCGRQLSDINGASRR